MAVASIDVRIDQDGSGRGGHDFGRDAAQPGACHSSQTSTADDEERGPYLKGGFEEHPGRVAAGEPDLGSGAKQFFQVAGPVVEHLLVALAHVYEVSGRGSRLPRR